jgi:hypothetical protein
VLDQVAHLVRHALRIALPRPAPGQLGQVPDGAAPRRAGLLRVLVPQFVQAERRPPRDLDGAVDRLGMAPKEARHLVRRLEAALGMGKHAPARLGHGAPVPDAGQHVLQGTSRRRVVMHVVGGRQRNPHVLGQGRQLLQALLIVRAVEARGGDREPIVVEHRLETADDLDEITIQIGRGNDDRQHPLLLLDQIVQGEVAFALGGTAFAQAEQAAQAPVGGAVGRVDQDRQLARSAQLKPAPHHQRDAGLLRRDMGTNDPRQGVDIGDGDRPVAQRRGPLDELLGMSGPAQEGEVAGDLQLRVAGRSAAARRSCAGLGTTLPRMRSRLRLRRLGHDEIPLRPQPVDEPAALLQHAIDPQPAPPLVLHLEVVAGLAGGLAVVRRA